MKIDDEIEKKIEPLEQYKKILSEIEKRVYKEKKKKEEEIHNKNTTHQNERKIPSQHISKHWLFESLKNSDLYPNQLVLLSEIQEKDPSQSYQKLMDLFLEESNTIKSESSANTIDDHLILQLYNAFSLSARKVYLESYDTIEESERLRMFFKMLNNLKFDKNKPLSNKMLSFINNNILRVQDIYQSEQTREQIFKKEKFNEILIQKEKEIPIIDAVKYNCDSYKDNEIDICFANENDDERIAKGESFRIKAKCPNVRESNERISTQKLKNLQKILTMSDGEFDGLTNEEIDMKMQKMYDEEDSENIIKYTNNSFEEEEEDEDEKVLNIGNSIGEGDFNRLKMSFGSNNSF